MKERTVGGRAAVGLEAVFCGLETELGQHLVCKISGRSKHKDFWNACTLSTSIPVIVAKQIDGLVKLTDYLANQIYDLMKWQIV